MKPRDPRAETEFSREAAASDEIVAAGLVGKPASIDDLDDLVVLFSNDQVAATLGGVRTASRVCEVLDIWCALWRARAFGPWIFRRAPKGDFVGYAGFALASAGQPGEIELLYAFRPEIWSQGVATATSRAAIDFLFRPAETIGGIDRLIAYTLTTNHASKRVIEKLGFAYEREIEHAGFPHAFYRLTREQWLEERETRSISVTF